MKKVRFKVKTMGSLLLFLGGIIIFSASSLANPLVEKDKNFLFERALLSSKRTGNQNFQGNDQNQRFSFPEKALFFNFNLGIFIFQQQENLTVTTFPAYGEEGSLNQTIRLSSPLGLEMNAGKYFSLGKLKLKTGLGFNTFPLKARGSFVLSMPHPFLYGSSRNYHFSEEFKNSLFHIYGFVYFVPLETWRLQLSVGPAVGLAAGKYPGLDNFEIEDKSPFRWSDLEIKNKTYKNSSFNSLSFGGGANLALFLVENMAFVMSYKYQYLKPQIDVLKQKVNLSFSRLIFWVEFSF